MNRTVRLTGTECICCCKICKSFVSFAEMYRELSRNDLISLTLSYDEKVKALTEEVCVLQKEMHQAR